MMAPSLLASYAGKSVLAVGAHPDQLILALGGTLAKLAQYDVRVLIAVVCIPRYFEQGQVESQRSAQVLGCEFRLLHTAAAAHVEDFKTYELVGMIDRLVRDVQPAAMFAHGPRSLHADHQAVHHACLASQRNASFDLFTFDPVTCHPVAAPFFPQVFVNIEDVLERKLEAIGIHAAKFVEGTSCTTSFRQIAAEQGRRAGCRYAEGLEVVRLMT